MGILDALSIMAGGATRGYRAQQEANRSIAESRRKALLDEKEMELKEREVTSAEALQRAQIDTQVAIKTKELLGIDSAKAIQDRNKQLVTPGGQPFNFKIKDASGAVRELNLPADREFWGSAEGMGFLRELVQAQTSRAVAGTYASSRENVAEAGGGKKATALDYATRAFNDQYGAPPDWVAGNPEKLAAWEATRAERMQEIIPTYVDTFQKIIDKMEAPKAAALTQGAEWKGTTGGSSVGTVNTPVKRKVTDDEARRKIETYLAKKKKPQSELSKDIDKAKARLKQDAAKGKR